MRNYFRCLIVFAFLSAVAACGSGTKEPNLDQEIDTRPEAIAKSRVNWRAYEGGVAERSGGLIIDIASGGVLRRDVPREIAADSKIEFVMTADANGDQSLRLRMAGGCGRNPVASEREEDVRLKTGFNRITFSNQFKSSHRCFVVEFRAINGPVSVTIEDASIFWRN